MGDSSDAQLQKKSDAELFYFLFARFFTFFLAVRLAGFFAFLFVDFLAVFFAGFFLEVFLSGI